MKGELGLKEMAVEVEEGKEKEKEKEKEEKKGLEGLVLKWRRKTWKICLYLVTIGMLVALLMGLNMSWTVLTAALVLMVLDFKDAGPCLDKVYYLFTKQKTQFDM